ncbi:serine/threonine-protein kinase [Streptomyces sp. NBC_00078]|uniref:serine/threonine-protein kinase n=1 Tax=Streptomyces sp. NBC_00078 TaxID=2975643 RepID=UPI00225621C3|nr:serine/threonine-protein kinase [Streptomyces sp. NBC_00078]MCX5422240.1 serine/threonine protein kinase [Streptomyces sp. NBC_00078]
MARGSRADEARARFLQEAQFTAALQHDNIVTVHDLGEATTANGTTPFLVMELLRGRGLDVILGGGPVDLADAARWGLQMCAALGEAHDSGILHRDVKPANIIVTVTGAVKVVDFGIAKAADPAMTSGLTQTGFIVGTPQYMAPEQAQDGPEKRSDLYALGCVLFEMITGYLPFKASNPAGYLAAHLRDTPPAPSSVAVGIPAAWDKVVLTLLQKDPGDRYASAADLAERLRELAADPGPGGPGGGTQPFLPEPNDGGAPSFTPQTATAAIALALLCLPGLLFMIFKIPEFIRMPGSPTGVLWTNLVVGVLVMAMLVTGAWLLSQRKMAGRRMIAITGALGALQGMSASAQALLTGMQLTMDSPDAILFFLVAPLTAAVAVAATVMAMLPSTSQWCLRRSQE